MIDPEEFGKEWWKMIHQAAATATTYEKRKAFKHYATKILPVILPCDNCAAHYRHDLSTYPIEEYMADRDTLFLWTYLKHDRVNKRLGKPGISYEEARRIYIPGQDGNDTVCTTKCVDKNSGEEEIVTPVREYRRQGGNSRVSYKYRG